MRNTGNKISNGYWEKNLADNSILVPESSLEERVRFVQKKYIQKKWVDKNDTNPVEYFK